MCGITGLLSWKQGQDRRSDRLGASLSKIRHRGPDRQEEFRDKGIALGHARLSIIEPGEAGDQPMWDRSGRYAIAFNGELYNFDELAATLAEEGKQLRSASDTELFLEWLAHRGEEGLEAVNGFFAFALWDRKEESVLIGRDRYGIKPLFLREEEGACLFASELEAILAYGVPKEIDRYALQCYFQLNYVPAPLCMVRGIRKLLPGEWMKLGKGVEKRGRLDQGSKPAAWEGSFQDAVDLYRERLRSAVRKRLRSDVPIGSFLSGGIDSGIIAALACKEEPGLPTFSIEYDDPLFDESKEAAETAAHIGSEHHRFRLHEEAFLEGVSDVLEGMDEPFADSSAIPVHLLSKWTKGYVKAVLSGDGADELFGGYNKHRAEFLARNPGLREKLAIQGASLWRWFPKSKGGGMAERIRKLDRFAQGASRPSRERYWRWASFLVPEKVRELLIDPLSPQGMNECREELFEGCSFERMEDLLQTDRSFVLPNDMLTKVDRMSMASGLEVRVPFLDPDCVRLAESFPSEWRIDRKERKLLLKRAFEDLLPKGSMERPKHGFEVPLADLLRKTYDQELLRLSEPGFLREQAIFREKPVREWIDALRNGKSKDNGAAVWSFLVFQKWWMRHFH